VQQRWSDRKPDPTVPFGRLHSWAKEQRHPDREESQRTLADDGIVHAIIERSGRRLIGALHRRSSMY
jgi:hypothetical protein